MVTAWVEGASRVTTNMKCTWSPLPSVTDRSAMEAAGTATGGVSSSSFRMVPMAVPSAMVAPDGLERVTVKVSSASSTVSARMSTWIILEVSPGAKVTVPDVAVKSTPDCAVPPEVAYCTVTAVVDALSSVTTNMKCMCSPSPSVTARSAMEMAGSVPGAVSWSSLTMVPTALPSATVAFTGEDRFSVKVSFSSTTASPTTGTCTVFTVSPGAKVRVPTLDA